MHKAITDVSNWEQRGMGAGPGTIREPCSQVQICSGSDDCRTKHLPRLQFELLWNKKMRQSRVAGKLITKLLITAAAVLFSYTLRALFPDISDRHRRHRFMYEQDVGGETEDFE